MGPCCNMEDQGKRWHPLSSQSSKAKKGQRKIKLSTGARGTLSTPKHFQEIKQKFEDVHGQILFSGWGSCLIFCFFEILFKLMKNLKCLPGDDQALFSASTSEFSLPFSRRTDGQRRHRKTKTTSDMGVFASPLDRLPAPLG